MPDNALPLLKSSDLDINQLTPVHGGMGGAHIYCADGKYIVKHAVFSDLDASVTQSLKNEYAFYKWSAARQIGYIPDILFQAVNGMEMIIVMKKHAALIREDWGFDMQKRAMRLCASINATSTDGFESLHSADKVFYDYPLAVSLGNWLKLHDRHPGVIDASLLSSMYDKHDEILMSAEKLAVPQTLCHGDFHPYNFLADGERLMICDWQSVSAARGIGDVAFFISRGSAMGIDIDKDMLIKEYHGAACRRLGETLKLEDLYTVCAASEFSVSFKFWAEHLQNSSVEQIKGIYDPMAANFKLLMSK